MKNSLKTRLQKANELLEFIADTDRVLSPNAISWFFSCKVSKEGIENSYSKFLLVGEKVYFADKYTGGILYPDKNSKRIGFSEGDTLWALVEDLREFIETGKSTNGNHGYGGVYYPGWGNRWTLELRELIVDKAKEIGFVDSLCQCYEVTLNRYKAMKLA